MVLLEQFCAVLAFAKEYFAATRVHLRVLCNVIDFTLVDGPAVVLRPMLCNLLGCVEYLVGIRHHYRFFLRVLQKFL